MLLLLGKNLNSSETRIIKLGTINLALFLTAFRTSLIDTILKFYIIFFISEKLYNYLFEKIYQTYTNTSS